MAYNIGGALCGLLVSVSTVVLFCRIVLYRSTTPPPVLRVMALMRRFRFIDRNGVVLQSGPRECGVAVMLMVLSHFGCEVRAEDVRKALLDCPRGTRLKRMKEGAAYWGLAARVRDVTSDTIGEAVLPGVVLYEGKHYLLVERVYAEDQVVIVDPLIGRCLVSSGRLISGSGGRMLEFSLVAARSHSAG